MTLGGHVGDQTKSDIDEIRRPDPEDPAQVETSRIGPSGGAVFHGKESGEQERGKGEEKIDADPPLSSQSPQRAGRVEQPVVVGEHQQESEKPQAVELRQIKPLIADAAVLVDRSVPGWRCVGAGSER